MMREPSNPAGGAAFRSFGIVPAAGRSRRMGTPKLLLPWGEKTVIEAVISAWRRGGVQAVIIVVHPDDEQLAAVCRAAGAEVVVARKPPPDMKASILLGLDHIQQTYAPNESDVFLTAPADLPTLSADPIRALLTAHDPRAPRIVTPMFQGRRGHPVLLPWPLSEQLAALPADAGLDALLRSHSLHEIELDPSLRPEDMDSPSDYQRLHDRHNRS